MALNDDNTGLYAEADGHVRCWWCKGHEDYQKYHDNEWGYPVTDNHRLFEKICLEGFQSGLSWLTILRKRENFRRAFRDFNYRKVANFKSPHVEKLLQNKGIVRHRGKIEATINNAARAVEMDDEFGSLAAWFWQFEPNCESRALFTSLSEARATTTCPEAAELSKALKKRGWKFVGPTTAYAFMQAMGMVNDHLVGCQQYESSQTLRNALERPVK